MEFTILEESSGLPMEVNAGQLQNYLGSATLEKVDSKGNPLLGARFDLLDEEGEVVLTDLLSNEEGIVLAERLSPGTYSFVERETIDGFILNTDLVTFTIEEEYAGQPEVIHTGQFSNYQGSIEFTKISENGQALSGAVFVIEDEAGEVVRTMKSDENGLVLANQLQPGSYIVREVDAPNGYLINLEERHFEILRETKGEVKTITLEDFVNYQGSVVLNKVDDNNHALEGASFELRDENKKGIHSDLTSDVNGKVFVEGLSPGDYTLVETKAPKGYKLSKEEVHFTIVPSADGKPAMVEVSLANEKEEIT